MTERVRKGLSRLTKDHFQAAARCWPPSDGYGRFHVDPPRWYVVINRRRYPPRAITALAHELAGYGRLTPGDFSRTNRFLHKALEKLKLRVVEATPGRRIADRSRLAGFAVGQKARPRDIHENHIRAAARQWSRDGSFLNFRQSLKYDVWIDPEGDGQFGRFPPKAIVSIAATKAGLRPLRTDELGGLKDGVWHRRLRDLGFRVLPKGEGEQPPSGQRARAFEGGRRTVSVTGEDGRGKRKADRTTLRSDLDHNRAVYVEEDPNDRYLDALLRDPSLPTAVRRQVAGRLGQGKFRKGLMIAYGGRCVLSGIDVPEVLRAAHIKAWAKCKDDPSARLDLHNGLLLHATYDSLFEAGLIAFADSGQILFSRRLSPEKQAELGLRANMCLPLPVSVRRQAYLRAHREAHLQSGHRYE